MERDKLVDEGLACTATVEHMKRRLHQKQAQKKLEDEENGPFFEHMQALEKQVYSILHNLINRL